MAITRIPPLDRTSPTFKSDVDTLFGSSIPRYIDEANATLENVSAQLGGGALSFPFSWSTSYAGYGVMATSSAPQNASRTLYIGERNSGGQPISSALNYFVSSGSDVKGQLRIQKQNDPSKWLIYSVIGASSTVPNYRNVSVVPIESSGPDPFVEGDPVILFFTRTGDIGKQGPSGNAYGAQAAKFSDRRASGANGGTNIAASTSQTRSFNTTEYNTILGASLGSSNGSSFFVMPGGTYDVWGEVPACGVEAHKSQLYSLTDSALLLQGSSEYSYPGSSQTRSEFMGRIILNDTKNLCVPHYTQQAVSNFGLGYAAGGGQVEVYSQIIFIKVS